MTTREALAAAWNRLNGTGSLQQYDLATVMDAAAKYLAQLPEKCRTCEALGDDKGRVFAGGTHAEWGPCPSCHGSGKVYPAELVERIADAIHEQYDTNGGYHAQAVAVLDALGETP